MDGAVGYGFGLVSEQSVHEVVSGIRDAVNRVKYTNDVFKVHNTNSTPKVRRPV
jgi:hypothetical protein